MVSAFLGPLCSYAFPVSGANTSDVSAPANHTTIVTAQQGQEQGTSVNITTANVAVADEAGAELLEQTRSAMAPSLTTRQKQELLLKLSSARYLAVDLMAAYVSLVFSFLLSDIFQMCLKFASKFDMYIFYSICLVYVHCGVDIILTQSQIKCELFWYNSLVGK